VVTKAKTEKKGNTQTPIYSVASDNTVLPLNTELPQQPVGNSLFYVYLLQAKIYQENNILEDNTDSDSNSDIDDSEITVIVLRMKLVLTILVITMQFSLL